jgi:Flp pilus assembly protein TadG
MENASKALIIAGAILISILLIAIGMYIYTGSQSTINSGMTQLSSQEVEAFNAQWDTYSGQQKGSNIGTLISKLISNASTNQNESTKLVSLECKGWVVTSASGGNASNNWYNLITPVEGALNTANFTIAKNNVINSHTYTVTFGYHETTGLINKIIVTY